MIITYIYLYWWLYKALVASPFIMITSGYCCDVLLCPLRSSMPPFTRCSLLQKMGPRDRTYSSYILRHINEILYIFVHTYFTTTNDGNDTLMKYCKFVYKHTSLWPRGSARIRFPHYMWGSIDSWWRSMILCTHTQTLNNNKLRCLEPVAIDQFGETITNRMLCTNQLFSAWWQRKRRKYRCVVITLI